MFAVLPLLTPHHGDLRRNTAPYLYTDGVSASCLNLANYAARELRKRGIKCYVEVILP
jgi:hypothetical protein